MAGNGFLLTTGEKTGIIRITVMKGTSSFLFSLTESSRQVRGAGKAESEYIPELCTELERTQIRRGILTETKYRMLANRGIANDHGLLIADALLYLREQTAGNDRGSSGI